MSLQEHDAEGSQNSVPQERNTEIPLTGSALVPFEDATVITQMMLEDDSVEEDKRRTQWDQLKGIWSQLTTNKLAVLGLCIVGFFVVVAIIGPFLCPYNPSAFSNEQLQAPSARHWLGTTKVGQDVLAQIITGARVSLIVGFATAFATTLISIAVGVSAGYFGGLWDDIASLITNLFLVIPSLVLIVLIASYLPFKGIFPIAMAITITSWAGGARGLRAQTMSMRGREFIQAARDTGESPFRLIFFEILPNEIPIVIPSFIATAIGAILTESALEFLGLGDPNVVSWGSVLFWAQVSQALLVGAWWWIVAPGVCLALLGAGLACINFGMDVISNPRLQVVKIPKAKLRKAATQEKEVAALS
jgi:peptide/nickel transport system permease protein